MLSHAVVTVTVTVAAEPEPRSSRFCAHHALKSGGDGFKARRFDRLAAGRALPIMSCIQTAECMTELFDLGQSRSFDRVQHFIIFTTDRLFGEVGVERCALFSLDSFDSCAKLGQSPEQPLANLSG